MTASVSKQDPNTLNKINTRSCEPFMCLALALERSSQSCLDLISFRFGSEFSSLSLCCHALACVPKMAATPLAFRAKYDLCRSEWLKLLG